MVRLSTSVVTYLEAIMPDTTDTTLFSITFTDPDNLKGDITKITEEIEAVMSTFADTLHEAQVLLDRAEIHVSEWRESITETGNVDGLWEIASAALGAEALRELMYRVRGIANPEETTEIYQEWAAAKKAPTRLEQYIAERRAEDDTLDDPKARQWAREQGFSEDYIVKVLGPVTV
jgi:hypothetical protein